MGGRDADDLLAGVEAMVERGIADPNRLGVTGGSYGGFMTSWLVTRTERFAAAVSIAPVTEWYSQHWTSNIGYWDSVFLGEKPGPGGAYYERSPVMHADRAKTPTLSIAGGQDRCTPAGQAVEFHRALLENGVDSELAVYPEEGHGVRQFPAVVDSCTRMVAWFERFMPAKSGGGQG
jgi:dipeptidyl aminopeptidase/acylaminoacyl peptidase